MPKMKTAEADAFLSERGHLLRLGTVDVDNMPSVVPIWFLHRDDKIWFTPRAKSEWFDHLRHNPNVCCTIDESVGSMRKLIARGQAQFVHDVGNDDEWRDIYREITTRYVPERFADAYLTDTHDEPRGLWALDLADARVETWRMPTGEGEDSLAVWAPKYYHDGRTS
jgi:nitroimidazol reductase NimA-like FMN-containing flavoprotein (pyridoxamine 5'-phosphate oxidase superfamily)